MSCALTQGFTIDCINSKGGVKILYVGEYEDLVSYTVVAGAITAMALATGKKLWTYNLERANASFGQTLTKNYDTGTKYYALKYDWNKKKMDVASQNEFDKVAEKRLLVMHKDNNGKYWIGGIENGCDLMTSETGSGKSLADMNGYTLGITGEEPNPVYEVPSGVVATLIVAAV